MEIVPGVYGVDFDGMVWGYLYRHRSRFTLIDCGIAGRVDVIESKLKELGAHLYDIEQLVLTHCHLDHAGTASELQRLTGWPTMAHKLAAAVIRGGATVADPQLADWERQLHEQIAGSIPAAPAARVDRELVDGDVINMGDEGTAIHVPGHTEGSIALYVESRRLLFTGDAVASIGRPIVGVFNIDPSQARDSFRRLSELDSEAAWCGHGPPIVGHAGQFMRTAAAAL